MIVTLTQAFHQVNKITVLGQIGMDNAKFVKLEGRFLPLWPIISIHMLWVIRLVKQWAWTSSEESDLVSDFRFQLVEADPGEVNVPDALLAGSAAERQQVVDHDLVAEDQLFMLESKLSMVLGATPLVQLLQRPRDKFPKHPLLCNWRMGQIS